MPVILILEGLTDATFFQELLARLYLQNFTRMFSDSPGRRNMPTGIFGAAASGTDLEVEFRYSRANGGDSEGGKSQIPSAVRLLLDGGVQTFAVAQDIDGGDPEQVVQSVHDIVERHSGTRSVGRQAGTNQIMFNDGSVTVMPMGLFGDSTLRQLGLTRHEMEDFLIKLLLEDASLREVVPDLELLLTEMLPVIRKYEGSFNSGKEIYQLIKPIVQHGFNDTGVVEKVVKDADEDILRSVLAPLLADVEQAFGLQP